MTATVAPDATKHRFAHLGLHLPLQRPTSMDEWRMCADKVDERADALDNLGLATFLCTDNNDRQKLWDPNGFKRIGGAGIDYIGVRLPSSLPAKDRPRVAVIKKVVVNGTIDRHDFYLVRVRVAWPDGYKQEFWVVQANLGRYDKTKLGNKTPAQVFVSNIRRLKGKAQGKGVWSLDEIDESDSPNEHELLGRELPMAKDDHISGWGTMSPTVVRGKQLRVASPRIWVASPGVAHVSPERPLVETIIAA